MRNSAGAWARKGAVSWRKTIPHFGLPSSWESFTQKCGHEDSGARQSIAFETRNSCGFFIKKTARVSLNRFLLPRSTVCETTKKFGSVVSNA
jgi:hypothetical protein